MPAKVRRAVDGVGTVGGTKVRRITEKTVAGWCRLGGKSGRGWLERTVRSCGGARLARGVCFGGCGGLGRVGGQSLRTVGFVCRIPV